MLPLIVLLLPGCFVHAGRLQGGAISANARDWHTVQPPLQEVLRSLWVPDLPRATASPAGAASALRQALWLPRRQPSALLPPLFALGEAAARAEQAEVVVESLRLVEDVATLAANAGHATPDHVTQLHRRLDDLYTQQFIPLVHKGLIFMAERTNGRAKAIAASLGERSSAHVSTGRQMRRAVVGPSAVLLSSSHWATLIITLVRGLHQHSAGSETWTQIRHNLRTTCPSSQIAQDDAQWRRLDGAAVVPWRTLSRLLEDCLVDADNIGTMVRVEGGDVNASNTAGWSPLHHAALLASGELVAALLASGAAPFARTALLGYTALHIAASRGASDVVNVLLSHEPSLISVVDRNNRTAMDIVCLHAPGILDSATVQHRDPAKRSSWLWQTYSLLEAAGAVPCAETSSAGGHEDDMRTIGKQQNAARVERHSKWADRFARADRSAAASMQKQLGLPRTLWMPSSDGDAASVADCDIAVRDQESLTSDTFYDDFVSLNRPVLMRRASGTGGTGTGGGWDFEMLERLFGSQQLHSVNVPYAQMFVGGLHSETTLPQFLDQMESGALDPAAMRKQHHYIFQTVSPAQEDVLRRTARLEAQGEPAVLQGAKFKAATRPGKFQLYVGPAGSGSPIHWHNDAVNYAVHGAKLWTLLPPLHAVYSRRHATVDTAEFFLHKNSTSALHCVQRAGDLMFVPDGWGHGVLNLESSTGYAQSWNGEHKVFSHDVPHRFLHNGQEKTIGAGLDSSKEK